MILGQGVLMMVLMKIRKTCDRDVSVAGRVVYIIHKIMMTTSYYYMYLITSRKTLCSKEYEKE